MFEFAFSREIEHVLNLSCTVGCQIDRCVARHFAGRQRQRAGGDLRQHLHQTFCVRRIGDDDVRPIGNSTQQRTLEWPVGIFARVGLSEVHVLANQDVFIIAPLPCPFDALDERDGG